MAVRLEIFRPDAELFSRDLHDRPLLGSLRNFNIRFRIGVLRRNSGRCFRRIGGGRIHENLIPGVSLAAAAKSLAAILGPSAWTRVTLKRPSAQTTAKPSLSIAAISPILPAMPFGSLAGSGVASKTFTVLPSSFDQAPGAGLQPRMRRSISCHGRPQSICALSGPQRPS